VGVPAEDVVGGAVMIAIGIDPGKDGALVAVERDGTDVLRAQLLFEDLGPEWWTPRLMAATFRDLEISPSVVALEAAQAARAGGGGMGSGTLGIGSRWGYLHAVASLVWPGVPILVTAASQWTKMLRDVSGEGKARSVGYVSSRLPDLDLTPGKRRKPHDGLADAGCLALYGLGKVRT
jgi:hypothetical protein